MFDIVVRGGTLIDGSGGPAVRADVGIRAGRVVALGSLETNDCRVIDATGRVVAPGFIDIHTHYDAQAFWDSTFSPSPLHGFTTIVAGNCGFGVAPLGDQADYMMRILARVEGMALGSIRGVPWNWATTAEYLDQLEDRVSTNVGFLVGHSTIRRVVMREEANQRGAKEEELAAIERLLRDGLEAGALGFSSSLAEGANDDEGHMAPSRYAEPEEMIHLAKVTGDYPGTSLEFVPTNGTFTPDRIDLMTRMSAEANRPLNWNALTVSVAERAKVEQRLAANSYAAAHGARLLGLLLPTPGQFRLTFWNGVLLDNMPGWAGPMTLPVPERAALLSDPEQRRRLDEQAQRPDNIMLRFANWGEYTIMDVEAESLKDYEGRVVADIAADEGKTPFDALLDIVVADGLHTGFQTPVRRNSEDDWKLRVEVCRDHRVVLGASDAGAHLDQTGQFNYSTVFIENAVRRRNLMSLEEAVHLLSEVPAKLYGMKGRGRLEEGAWADMVIFDPQTVGSAPLKVRHDLPEQGMRMFAEAIGVDAVLVNGVEIVVNGKFTDKRPGTVLRSGRDTADVTAR
jgi:N-acyl-D-aspartate/D-glutamate deacylase